MVEKCIISVSFSGKTYRLRVLAYSNGGDGRMSSPTHTFQMGKIRREDERIY